MFILRKLYQSEKATYYVIPNIWHLEKENYGNSKKTTGYQALEVERIRQSIEDAQGNGTTLYDVTIVIHVIINVSKTTEYTTLRTSPKVNYELQVTRMYQCMYSYINYNNCSPLVGNVTNACLGTWGLRKISVPST